MVRDRELRIRTKPLRFQDESNMAAYAFVAAKEEDTHEPLTYQEVQGKVILALTACKDYELEQLDVKTAFLHENLEDVIYIRQPQGYKQDDMLIVCKSKAEIGSTKSLLKKEFDMKELVEAKKILGMKIVRDRSRNILRVSQSRYVSKVLNNFRIDNGKSVKMPLGGHFKLSLKDCPVRDCDVERMSKVSYANAVGSSMYLMVCTRPDIAYAVMATMWTYHVLLIQTKLRIQIEVGHGCDVSWKAMLQHMVALSTTEAEYMALTKAVKESIWLRRLLEELGVELNTVAVLEAKTIKVLKVGTKHNAVDALTKVVTTISSAFTSPFTTVPHHSPSFPTIILTVHHHSPRLTIVPIPFVRDREANRANIEKDIDKEISAKTVYEHKRKISGDKISQAIHLNFSDLYLRRIKSL
ncbi:retrotransposon protein, putative, ty1-copia subclass [Tanacetum coccineum]